MRTATRCLRGAGLLLAVAVLGGCQGGNVSSDLTVEQAKADTQRFELEVAELVPAEITDRVEQLETGTLLRCGPDQEYGWTGNTAVYLSAPPADDAELLQSIADSLDEAEIDTESGAPRLIARGPEGQNVIVGVWEDGAYVNIASSSACFILPEDADPLGDY